jgi:hypothetical protein
MNLRLIGPTGDRAPFVGTPQTYAGDGSAIS